jgi:hypothetical protein
MAVDDQLLRELEQYHRRAGTDSLLKTLQKACGRGGFQCALDFPTPAGTGGTTLINMEGRI